MDVDVTLQQPFTHAVVVESDMSAVTYNLGPVALIPFGEGRMFEVGDTTIAVFRVRGGQVYATEQTPAEQTADQTADQTTDQCEPVSGSEPVTIDG